MINNIFFFTILSIILGYIYYKIKFPFWSKQPVFHFHNLRYWFFPPGIIQSEKPKIDKFFDASIDFYNFDSIPTEKKALFTALIQSHYMPHKHEKYTPSSKDIFDYFVSHEKPSFLSLNFKNSTLISSMTTRPLKCTVNKNSIDLYYFDFLCVHQNFRKKGNAPKTIYTHYYKSRYQNNNSIFLFKREGETTAIVPLTAYRNYCYDLRHFVPKVEFTHPKQKTVLINDSNLRLFFDIEKTLHTHFDCYISPCYSNLKHLIAQKLLFITMILDNNNAKAFYVFRNPHTSYDSKKALECICSCNYDLNDRDFITGFNDSLSMLIERFGYNVIFVENISNNNILNKHMIKNYYLKYDLGASYYFYNFACRHFANAKVLIII